MTFKKTFLPAVILALICLVCAAALAFTNRLTEDRIAEVAHKRYLSSVATVLPEGALLEEISLDGVDGFIGKREDGSILGYAVKTAAKGYGGTVTCVVGFDAEGRVIGVSVDAPDETPGLGNNVTKPEFTEQFIGAEHAPVLGEDFDAVTSATYSSRAVEAAVADAFSALQKILKGE